MSKKQPSHWIKDERLMWHAYKEAHTENLNGLRVPTDMQVSTCGKPFKPQEIKNFPPIFSVYCIACVDRHGMPDSFVSDRERA